MVKACKHIIFAEGKGYLIGIIQRNKMPISTEKIFGLMKRLVPEVVLLI